MTEVTHASPVPTTPTSGPAPRALQPLLHDLASCVAAPGSLLSASDGQVRPGGVQGWYSADVRLLDRLEVEVEGSALELVRSASRGSARHEASYVARGLGDALPDPTVRLDRVRELGASGFVETLTVESTAQETVEVVLHLTAGSDLAPMAVVKQGGAGDVVAPVGVPGGLRWAVDGAPGVTLLAAGGPPVAVAVEDAVGRLSWRLRLRRGERVAVRADAALEPAPDASRGAGFGPGRPARWALGVEASDVRLERLAHQSLADLEGLLLRDGEDRFLAAGSPWFLTLFGRDSLWAARMLAPLDPDLVLSTLRVLARRQGERDDATTEEQPGKILHEVRGGELDLGEQVLPPVYYGTVDATPLFVCALADAHAWGADPGGVRALLPAARRCLEWVLEQSRESGWLRYVDSTGRGLSNQGWKDSHDSVQFADGALAEAPIALSEVQAYAHEAAVRGAALLAALGEQPVPGLADWARALRTRFADAFWVGTDEGGHVAIALDGAGRRVDSVTSNQGHLLGTGLLEEPAAARVASLLVDERLDSGFGLRTLAADSPRFSRLSYHGGSVWPHDTAVAVRGLAAHGRLEEAARLTAGVVAAAEGFAYRLPELYAGDAAADVPWPAAYPAACRPQAWSAAAPLTALVAVTGLDVDVPAGVVRHPARTSTRLGAFRLRGLRAGEERLDVAVGADGAVEVLLEPGSRLRVVVD
ncbi:glycogen debranching N-terminal domain-containing protein [Nocardioides kribbensis]|uniref:Glycogen debranching N-terminal domain-containing protein n=1 Tax=Nocardioides kribbensis TaxID=305517 RepID=A0ABV1NU49_9ACTN